jgi:hypothetical protein
MSACLMLHQLVCTHILFYKPYAPGSVACREGIEDVVLSNLKSNSVMRLATATVETSSDYCCLQGGH